MDTKLIEKNNLDDELAGWKSVNPKSANKKQSKSNSNLKNLDKNQKKLENFIDYNQKEIQIIRNLVQQKIKILIVLRGSSGSGKSSLANQIKSDNSIIISADQYFTNPINGVYSYDKNKLTEAHLNCKLRASDAMKKNVSPIIIDNTNIKIWEFKPYIKLAVKYDYQVEIIEPNTPWKSQANLLAEKNIHNVPMIKVKQMLNEFEKIDLKKLINECRQELDKDLKNTKQEEQNKIKPKGLLGSSMNFLANSDWSLNSSDMNINSSIMDSFNFNKSEVNILKNDNSLKNVDFYLNDSFSNNEQSSLSSLKLDTKLETQKSSSSSGIDDSYNPVDSNDLYEQSEIVESLNVLKVMFPDIKQEIIVDFLLKYENDVNMVTNLLLDSFNFSSVNNIKEEENKSNKEEIYQVKTLQELCLIEMDKLETAMEDLNKKIKMVKSSTILKRSESSKSPELAAESKETNLIKKSQSESSYLELSLQNENNFYSNTNLNCFCNKYRDKNRSENNRIESDEEPIIFLKVNKLKCLVDLFGTPEELENLNENSEIPIDLDLAFKIYESWKKGIQPKANNNLDSNEQIENDKKISIELFEEINMRDPIDKIPIYMSDKGVNSAELSLRQIMAEEMAEQKRNEKLGKKRKNQPNKKDSWKNEALLNLKHLNLHKQSKNESEYIANRIKLKHLFETYENLVDKKMIEEIFKEKNYNFTETTNYINSFYGYDHSELKEPNKVYDIKTPKKKLNTKEDLSGSNSYKGIDYYSAETRGFITEEIYEEEDGRNLALKYLNIRQGYFEKAAEAYNRGWGAVAQYYAEMGHEQTKRINVSNNLASFQIFKANNPDINNSNTLDLHGLHVKEAITVLKNILYEKRIEFYSLVGKKQKSYLFVITGYGHHSENGPRLRPNVINFLNQNGIK